MFGPFQRTLLSLAKRPPPLKCKLPPPPPLRGLHVAPSIAEGRRNATRRSPQEVLTQYIEYMPTYFTPLSCVAAILPEEERELMAGRGKFLAFLRKYPFLFDVRQPDNMRCDVRLRPDVSHPNRGAADNKFAMTDVGEHTDYVAKPEYITSTEPLDSTTNQVVNLMPPSAPPAIKVNLEERVPVMGRLQALVPTHFTDIDKLEEGIPEDVLFHPYFDCQGGLRSIGQKFPDYFQVVENTIRRRPAHLAPMALGDLTLQQSPLPDVAELVRKEVCDSDIPHWVSVTYLYEQLTSAQKREIKTHFKSFSSFLRAHGSELAMSIDLLQVSMWARNPTAGSVTTPIEKGGVAAPLYTPVQVLNELFDRFPRNKTLSLKDALELLPKEMVLCLPRNVAGWLSAQKRYFIVDHLDEKENLEKVTVRRRSDTQPLDLVFLLYRALAAKDTTHVAVTALDELLDPAAKTTLSRLGVGELASVAPEWLAIGEEEGTPHLYALRSLEALEERILSEKEESKQDNANRQRQKEYLDKKERQFMAKPPPKFEGGE